MVTPTIPKVVQRALGSGNIGRFSNGNDDTIFGLRGFLLPQYLSLRYQLPSKLEEGLRLAQQEHSERDYLQSCQNNIITAATSKEAQKSKKKRKRRSKVNLAHSYDTTCSGHKRKRRRKKEGKNTLGSTNVVVGYSSNEIKHYRMMSRIIIAPFTPQLIATINQYQESKAARVHDGGVSNGGAETTCSSPDNTTNNVYIKQPEPTNTNLMSISPPKESLEWIVDGAICTLVRRTHKFRNMPTVQKTVGKSNYRRRRRRKLSRPQQEQNLPRIVKSTKKDKADNNSNKWLLERNLLSAGYTLGNSDTLTSSPNKRNAQEITHNQFLRGCPNMAPGIHCLQPNTLATYARSSELMQFLHTEIGDEVLREILMNAVILIPAIAADSVGSDDRNCNKSFEGCNYFQLCGPPLNTVAKKFEQMANEMSSLKQKEAKLLARKRKRDEDEEISNTNNEVEPNEGPKALKTARSLWDANKPIPRSNLFYCDFYTKRVGLSPQHVLNQKGEEQAMNFQLLNSMVQIFPKSHPSQTEKKGVIHTRNKRRKRWRRLRESGIAMCKEIRRRYATCDFSRLLEYHCPLSEKSNILDEQSPLSHLVTLDTPAKNVAAFIRSLLSRAFPNSFWGSRHNFDQAVKAMTTYLNLRRAEAFPEKAIVLGIRVLDMKWLHSQQSNTKLSRIDHEATTVIVRNVMRWLYTHFINPILRSTFYITETEFSGTRVLYYRRPLWMRIRNASLEMLLRKEQYREMSSDKVKKLLSNHNIGCPPAPLRFLPKKTGIRAIAMLSKTCDIGEYKNKSSKPSPPNRVMLPIFHALRYEYEKDPTIFGAGVMGLTEVYPSFCSFVDALKELETESGSPQELFFTSADIKHCYDTIHQQRLFKLIRTIIEEEMYLTKDKFILCYKGDKSTMRCIWKKKTCPPEQFSRSSPNILPGRFSKAIFVDGMYCSTETNRTITNLLRDHIFGQVVVANGNFGPRYLHQKNGIPQGSILSSLFCNTYFGRLEKVLFDNVFDETTSKVIRGNSHNGCDSMLVKNPNALHLLLRIVDDFLLISTDKNVSTHFLEKLNEGIPNLGVKVNKDKTQMSYSVPGNVTCDVQDKGFFPWCGLLINTASCEVTLDNQRFSGQKAIDTVSVHRLGNEGTNLRKAMKGFVRPRCNQQLLFSSRINSIDNVRLNFYQAILLCAIKTVHYIESSDITLSSEKTRNYIYESVCDTIQYSFLLITSKLKTDFNLLWEEALWLGKHAFKTKLKRHESLASLFSESREGHSSLKRRDLVSVTKRAANQFDLT